MNNYVEMYGCKKADLEALEEIISYFRYHNKNLTTMQYELISILEEKVDKIRGRFVGYDVAEETEL